MKGYFKHITFKYNTETCKTMKEYCNEIKRLAQQQERLKFILSCRNYGIIPNHTKNLTTQVTQLFTCTTIKGKLGKIENNFHKKILNLEISQTNLNIKLIKRKIYLLSAGIEEMIEEEDYTKFINEQKQRAKHIIKNIKETQTAKLNTLKENKFKLHGLVFNNEWFENKTEVNIPLECKWMLSLGKKFSLPINERNFSPIHVIADIENCILTIDDYADREKDALRTKLANQITSFKRKIKINEREKFIFTAFEKTKTFLNDHQEIIIIQADKGNKTVAMYKWDYEEKMKKLLEDKITYKTLRTDPTSKLQKINNNMVADLHNNGFINLWQKRQLICSAATAPRIYGLPKIHKPGIPLRPIVSSFQVPCYELSKFVGKILKNIISEQYNVKNSLQVKEQLKNMKLQQGEMLVSFDVISLFTNIPVHTAIRNIMTKWNTIKDFTKIPSAKFLKILQFCLQDNNYFVYGKKTFNQIFGMPMGNPLSPTIADITLDCLLDEAILELEKKNIHIKYIVKYVDDILAIIHNDDKDEILSTFNKYHKKIQFTIEMENNGQLAYLDTKLHRIDNNIIFDWYAKATSSGRIMNFHTTQPKNQIINTAKNFIFRVINISDAQFHNKNIKIIKETLKNNSFPKNLVNLLLENTLAIIQNKSNNQCNNIIDKQQQKKFYSVKYIPGLTNNKNLKTTMKTKNICFAYKPNTTLSTIYSKIKAPIDKKQQSNVVYEIQCNGTDNENCELIYIGTTKRTLETRMGEHQMDILKGRESTALAKHIIESKHTANIEGIRILDREGVERKRYTIESLRIQQNIHKTMNKKEDTDNISASYLTAIN